MGQEMRLHIMLDHQWRMPGNFDVLQAGFSWFGNEEAWHWLWTTQVTVLGLVFVVAWSNE